ncbi:MAG: AAA family ATPase [Betaproteobacteria bacterium]|nr:AAA family ATPase [Betaproteobacteria bacterium]
MSEAQRLLKVTRFADVSAQTKHEYALSWSDLFARLTNADAYERKADAPLLKLGTFGDDRTEKGALRTDANMLGISGIEGDYDAGAVSPMEAIDMLERHGIRACVYTSPSHTDAKPRWRVLAPLSADLPVHHRDMLMRRLNGALGGILTGESFTLSQTYYYGRVNGHPYQCLATFGDPEDGTCINLLSNLAEIAIGPPRASSTQTAEVATDEDMRNAILSGENYHEALRSLGARFAGRGMAADDIVATLEGLMDQSKAPHDARWQNRRKSLRRLADSAIGKYQRDKPKPAYEGAGDWTADVPPPGGTTEAPGASNSAEWPSPIDLSALATREPEQPQFVVKDWLPAGYATLLAGHGGVGKSAIALHLAVCIALGLPFAGMTCERRRVLYLSCEDRESVLHWRLDRICRHLRVSLAVLAGHLNIVELVGHDSILWDRDPRTGLCVTPAFGQLEARMRDSGAKVLMVDGVTDTFGGNENARTEVKRYVNALLALVPSDTGALLLVGHVAKLTAGNAATSEGYSGSTGWHNAVRARWYLYPETEQDEDGGRAQRTGRLQLELQKSNLGPNEQAMTWHWDDQAHMFLPEPAPSHLDRKVQDRDELQGIRLAMRGCIDAGLHVPSAATGSRTAYLVLAQRPEFPASLKGGGKPKTRRFWRQIEQLRQMQHIAEDGMRRKNRHAVAVFVLTSEGRAACVVC